MLARIRQTLQPPVFLDDADKTRIAGIIHRALTALAVFLVSALTLLYIFNLQAEANPALAFVLLIAVLVFRFFLQRGFVRLVAIVLAAALLLAVSYVFASFGTIRLAQAAMLLIPIVFAALLLDFRWGVAFYLASILLAFTFYRRELAGIAGWLPTPSPLNQLVVISVTNYLIFALMNLARRGQDEALARARASEASQLETIRALETAQAELAQRARLLETSALLSRRLSTILDQDELVQTLSNLLQQEFGYSHVHVYFYDRERKYLEVVGGSGEVGQALARARDRIPAGQGLLGRATDTLSTILAPDVSREPDWLPNPFLPGTKSEIAAPIMAGGQVLGALHVQHNEVGGLTQNDADFVGAAAAQAAVALQNARLFLQIQHNAEQQVLLNTITQRIQSTNDVDSAMKVAVRELGRALNARQTSVQLQLPPQDETR
jgi:putative methionine-R-sulfoxide reductase with GAF domain